MPAIEGHQPTAEGRSQCDPMNLRFTMQQGLVTFVSMNPITPLNSSKRLDWFARSRTCFRSGTRLKRSVLWKELGILALGAVPLSGMAQILSGASSNTDLGDSLSVAYTGQTIVLSDSVSVGGISSEYTVPMFGEDAKSMPDRLHEWNGVSVGVGLPGYLLGREYVMVANDGKFVADWEVTITLSQPARVYLLIDNRVGDSDASNPPDLSVGMTWAGLASGWNPMKTGANSAGDTALPDEVGVDELFAGQEPAIGSGVSVDNRSSVYFKDFPSGDFSVFEINEGNGRNLYGLVVAPVPELGETALVSGLLLSGWIAWGRVKPQRMARQGR